MSVLARGEKYRRAVAAVELDTVIRTLREVRALRVAGRPARFLRLVRGWSTP